MATALVGTGGVGESGRVQGEGGEEEGGGGFVRQVGGYVSGLERSLMGTGAGFHARRRLHK